MRINTNVAALNSYNQLSNTQDNLSKSLERLSSGKRINGAADDAAGLAISEKMNGQVRGLGQAQRNAQDAISMNQTAEGALKESHSILQRMRELSVQSANDTNTKEDRAEIQEEVNQLAKELTRIGNTTEFNTQKLLDGSLENMFQIGANEDQNMEMSINDMRADALGVGGFGDGIEVDVSDTVATGDAGAVEGGASYEVTELDETVTVSDGTNSIDANYAMKDENGEVVAVSNDGASYSVMSTATSTENLGTMDNLSSDTNELQFGDVATGEITTEEAGGTIKASGTAEIEFQDAELESGDYNIRAAEADDVYDGVESPSDAELVMTNSEDEVVAQTQSASGNAQTWKTTSGETFGNEETYFDISADNSFAGGDEVSVSGEGVDVSSQESANSAIETIDDAIGKVSSERSKLGAVQNRLEHTINNLNTAEENLTAAESRISDVDMAEEMMNMSKQQILSQAGTAMMAQANQLPQGVLKLLG